MLWAGSNFSLFRVELLGSATISGLTWEKWTNLLVESRLEVVWVKKEEREKKDLIPCKIDGEFEGVKDDVVALLP